MIKLSYLLAGLVILSVFLLPSVLALENNTSSNSTNGVAVNNTNEYIPSNLRYGWENFKSGFIINKTAKIERKLMLANWKIAQSKKLFREGQIERAEKAIEKHDKLLDSLEKDLVRIENKSLTPGLDNAIKIHEERLKNLQSFLQNQNLTDKQREIVGKRIEKIINRTSHLEGIREKIENKITAQREKAQNKSNSENKDSDDED